MRHGQLEYRSSASTGRPIIAAEPADGPTTSPDSCKRRLSIAAWLESLPDSLQDGATAEALRTICELDLSELQAIAPPRGFGRD